MPVVLTVGGEFRTSTGEKARVESRSVSGLFWVALKGKQKFADGQTLRPYLVDGKFKGDHDVVWPDLVKEVGGKKPQYHEEDAFPEEK